MRLDALPVDGIAVSLAKVGILEERRHEVDPGLDREDVAGQERQVDAQPRELVLRRLTPAQDLAGVADAEADHVADAVREEERLRAALDQALRLAAQQPELDQALGDDQRRRAVHIAPLGTGGAALGRTRERRRDDLVDLLLLRREPPEAGYVRVMSLA